MEDTVLWFSVKLQYYSTVKIQFRITATAYSTSTSTTRKPYQTWFDFKFVSNVKPIIKTTTKKSSAVSAAKPTISTPTPKSTAVSVISSVQHRDTFEQKGDYTDTTTDNTFVANQLPAILLGVFMPLTAILIVILIIFCCCRRFKRWEINCYIAHPSSQLLHELQGHIWWIVQVLGFLRFVPNLPKFTEIGFRKEKLFEILLKSSYFRFNRNRLSRRNARKESRNVCDASIPTNRPSVEAYYIADHNNPYEDICDSGYAMVNDSRGYVMPIPRTENYVTSETVPKYAVIKTDENHYLRPLPIPASRYDQWQ